MKFEFVADEIEGVAEDDEYLAHLWLANSASRSSGATQYLALDRETDTEDPVNLEINDQGKSCEGCIRSARLHEARLEIKIKKGIGDALGGVTSIIVHFPSISREKLTEIGEALKSIFDGFASYKDTIA